MSYLELTAMSYLGLTAMSHPETKAMSHPETKAAPTNKDCANGKADLTCVADKSG